MIADLFPIMTGFSYETEDRIRSLRKAGIGQLIVAVPWAMLMPHERQAQSNHGQSLSRLASRGGLGADEAVAILEDRRHHRMTFADSQRRLGEMVSDWNNRRSLPPKPPQPEAKEARDG